MENNEQEKALTKAELKEQKRALKEAQRLADIEQKERDAKKKAKVKKDKKSLGKKLKETGSELKKVTWPKFSTVAKSTGVVIAVVVFFTVVLFGFDTVLGLLYDLATHSMGG